MSRFNIGHAACVGCLWVSSLLNWGKELSPGPEDIYRQLVVQQTLLGSMYKIHEHASLHPHYSFLKYMPLITDTQRGVYRRQELPKAHTASRW